MSGVHFTVLPLWRKRGLKCRRRNCFRTAQWSESQNRGSSYGRPLCDEHAMERLRKVHLLRAVGIERPAKVVDGRAL